jgi:predicted nucleic acid-binding Zn ribbon protein
VARSGREPQRGQSRRRSWPRVRPPRGDGAGISGETSAGELQEVGRVLREALGEPRFKRGLALGRLARAWEDVVGPRLARETAPASLDEGGLVVAVSSGAWGAQVRFLTREIRQRANQVLGTEEIRAVRVVVGRPRR